jgi:VCBS repeat-containing protein
MGPLTSWPSDSSVVPCVLSAYRREARGLATLEGMGQVGMSSVSRSGVWMWTREMHHSAIQNCDARHGRDARDGCREERQR